jgi:menaquinone-specific isochorismate synthase
MLEQANDPHFGTAWWRDSESTRRLRAHSWQAEAPKQGLAFFAPDFALNHPRPWLHGDAETPHDAETFSEAASESLPPLNHRSEPSSGEFARLHEEILRRIDGEEFHKVVPIVYEELEFARPLRAGMFTSLLGHEFSHQIVYGFECADEGMVGVTPELLFRVRDGILQTMALAGTGRADGPDLWADPKERREHEMVIEHITTELHAWGAAAVGRTEERVYGKLKHLYTPIRLVLNREIGFMDLVVRLHPTAALGGWPRRPAVEWLESQAFHVTRRRFGAPFGFLAPDEMACAVAIRGLQWHGSRALLASGCGVVRGSEVLREWKELELKRAATASLLGLDLNL